MPAPPKKGESKKDFIGRCIPVVESEGYKHDQAVAICYSMWEKSKKKNVCINVNDKRQE